MVTPSNAVKESRRMCLLDKPEERLYAMVERVSYEVSKRAVNATLLSLGVDAGAPIEAQKDMAALREIRMLYDKPEFQQDMAALRAWRTSLDQVKSKGFLAAVTMVCTGGLALILYALKSKLM